MGHLDLPAQIWRTTRRGRPEPLLLLLRHGPDGVEPHVADQRVRSRSNMGRLQQVTATKHLYGGVTPPAPGY